MEISLRNGCLADADALTDLFIKARRRAMPYLPELYSREETRHWMEHVVLKSDVVTVAEYSEKAVGFAAIRNNHLEHLYVATNAQGAGIGSKLLQNIRNAVTGMISLHVFQRNERARNFYEKHGFHCAAFTDGSGNEEGEPDAIYLSERSWYANPC